jgi:hypothetical protein
LQREGERTDFALGDERQGQQVFAPREHERKSADRDERGLEQREYNARHGPKPPTAIDHRRILEIARDGIDVALEHPDGDRKSKRQVREDKCRERVGEAEVADDDHNGHQHRHDRKRLRAEDEQVDRRLAAKLEPAQGIGCWRREHRRDDRDSQPHDKAVAERDQEALLVEDRDVMDEGDLARPRIGGHDVRLRLDGAEEDPNHREEKQE